VTSAGARDESLRGAAAGRQADPPLPFPPGVPPAPRSAAGQERRSARRRWVRRRLWWRAPGGGIEPYHESAGEYINLYWM